jgi:hypothetical protein
MRHPASTPRRAAALPARLRASMDVGGHVGALLTSRAIEERHDSLGARRALGDVGGHVGAPHVK